MLFGLGLILGSGMPKHRGGAGPAPTGFDVHVDSVSGRDAGDGLQPATAKQSIAAAQALAVALGPGTRIGLARGSLWDEQLRLTAQAVLVGSYGDPARPLPMLRGSDLADGAAFAPAAGRAGVFEIAWHHELSANGKAGIFVWEDGTRLVWVGDDAECSATPGSFTYPEPLAAGTVVVRVHPRGSTDPASDGKTYRITRRNHGVWLSGHGSTVDGVHATHNGHDDGAIKIGERAHGGTVRNTLATRGTKHAFFVWARDARFENCVGYVCGGRDGEALTTFVAYHDDAEATGDVAFENCWAHAPEGPAPDFAGGDSA